MDEMYDESGGGAEKPPVKEIKVTELENVDDSELLLKNPLSDNLSHKVNHLDERVTKVEQKVDLKHNDSFPESNPSPKKSTETNILDFM